jgi:hypothetical protein
MVSKVRTDGYSVGRPCGIKLSAQRVVYAARGTWLWALLAKRRLGAVGRLRLRP